MPLEPMPAGDRVYTEADMHAAQDRWERMFKEREWSHQLATLSGQLQGMPELIRSTARQVALEVITEVLSKQQEKKERRFPVTIGLSLNGLGIAVAIFLGILQLSQAHR